MSLGLLKSPPPQLSISGFTLPLQTPRWAPQWAAKCPLRPVGLFGFSVGLGFAYSNLTALPVAFSCILILFYVFLICLSSFHPFVPAWQLVKSLFEPNISLWAQKPNCEAHKLLLNLFSGSIEFVFLKVVTFLLSNLFVELNLKKKKDLQNVPGVGFEPLTSWVDLVNTTPKPCTIWATSNLVFKVSFLFYIVH